MTTAKSCVNADFAALKPGVPECPSRWMVTRYRLVFVQMWVRRSAKSIAPDGPSKANAVSPVPAAELQPSRTLIVSLGAAGSDTVAVVAWPFPVGLGAQARCAEGRAQQFR